MNPLGLTLLLAAILSQAPPQPITLTAVQAALAIVGGCVAIIGGCVGTFYLVRRERTATHKEHVAEWQAAIAEMGRGVEQKASALEALRAERAARIDERMKAMGDASDREFKRLGDGLKELSRSLQGAWRQPQGKAVDGDS